MGDLPSLNCQCSTKATGERSIEEYPGTPLSTKVGGALKKFTEHAELKKEQ